MLEILKNTWILKLWRRCIAFRQEVQPKTPSLEQTDWQQAGSNDLLTLEYQKITIYFSLKKGHVSLQLPHTYSTSAWFLLFLLWTHSCKIYCIRVKVNAVNVGFHRDFSLRLLSLLINYHPEAYKKGFPPSPLILMTF